MRTSRAFCLMMVIAAFAPLHPKLAHAQSGYAQFKLGDAQDLSMDSAQYTGCMNRANAITASMNDCIGAEFDRLDRRLNSSYRAALGRLSRSRASALRASERAWLTTRDAACLAELDVTEAGMMGTLDALQLRFCTLSELKRRIVWLERLR
jgi:uncharacterized protein YecT (DUF1311 family)